MYPTSANFIRFEKPVYLIEDEDVDEPAATQVGSGSEGKDISNAAMRELLIEQTLDATVPPRVCEDEKGKKFVLALSREPLSRDEIRSLESQYDQWLILREAKTFGICPIRRELSSELFDEVIRQATILSPDRGQLFLRCREESRMSIILLETLANDSIAWAKRVALETENVEGDTEATIEGLEKELEPKKESLVQLEYDLDNLTRRYNAEKAVRSRRHSEKMEFLKKINQQMSDLMEMIMKDK